MNEWADKEADAAAKSAERLPEPMVAAAEVQPTYGSLEMLDAKGELVVGGARAWVRAGAQREAVRRLVGGGGGLHVHVGARRSTVGTHA